MKKLFMMSLVALVCVTMASCLRVKVGDGEWSLGKGHVNNTPTQVTQVNEVTQMQPFAKVNLEGPFDIVLEQGEGHSVRVEATAEQLEKMTIYVKDEGLYIDQRKNESGKTFDGVKVFVTAPMIKDINLAGSGDIVVPKALEVADLNISLAGSGDIAISQLTCHDMKIGIAGSGDVIVGPTQANTVKISVAGSGDIEFEGLTCTTLSNSIAGSGDLTFNNMNVDLVKNSIAGSGNVTLRGKVGSHKDSVAGSGTVDVSGLTQ